MRNEKTLIFTLIFIVIGFSTIKGQWTCGDIIIDSRDGQTYKTVQIGSQCWMSENLNYGTMIQSTAAGHQMTDNGIAEKYCWSNDTNYCCGTVASQKFGAYYEWNEAVQNYSSQPPFPVQGLCPAGWHIPTRAEFDALTSELGGSSIAGEKMKAGGSSGFNGILTGYRCTMTGGFRLSPTTSDTISFYWTAEQSDGANAYFYELTEGVNTFMQGAYSPYFKSLGLCIRCIKNGFNSINESGDIDKGIQINYLSIADNQIVIEYDLNKSQDINFCISDLWGRILYNENMFSKKGKNTNSINISDFAKGIYIIVVSDEKQLVSRKIIKV